MPGCTSDASTDDTPADEATAALDTATRMLVTEAILAHRRNKTTIVITHDLTPIKSGDFVYVMEHGQVVEQGYRNVLEANGGGPYHTLASKAALIEDTEDDEMSIVNSYFDDAMSYRRSVLEDSPRTFTSAYFGPSSETFVRQTQELSEVRRRSALMVERLQYTPTSERRLSRPASCAQTPMRPETPRRPRSQVLSIADFSPSQGDVFLAPPLSRQTSGVYQAQQASQSTLHIANDPRRLSTAHNYMVAEAARAATAQRLVKRATLKVETKDEVVIEVPDQTPRKAKMGLSAVTRAYYPDMPNKSHFILGLATAVALGACTPVFSYLLAQLLANLGDPDPAFTLRTSLIIIAVALVESFGNIFKYWILERCGITWIASLRSRGLTLVLKQDKQFFDDPANSVSALVTSLVKDCDDAKALVGTIAGQLLTVVAMLTIGITWAFVSGWELTLVGCGLLPVFVIVTRIQHTFNSRIEIKNKERRETVALRFHQVRIVYSKRIAKSDIYCRWRCMFAPSEQCRSSPCSTKSTTKLSRKHTKAGALRRHGSAWALASRRVSHTAQKVRLLYRPPRSSI